MRRITDNLAVKLHTARRRREAERTGRQAVSAFTLTELLVVIALTGLLLALIIGPLIQGFRLTNRARALAEAQDSTRFGLERLKRELVQAAYVYDNANTPIILPLDAATPTRTGVYGDIYPLGANGQPVTRPQISYAKLDFVPAATLGEGPGVVIDPTTNKPLGGMPLQVPISPGRRIVRYFIGLRRNLDQAGNPLYYQNVYEFPRTDNGDLNTFILYRAEFDPNDPDLVDQRVGPFQPGGLHDPNFFYNTGTADSAFQVGNQVIKTGNGARYAENWRKVSSPVLNTTNLDVLAWRRDAQRQISQTNPFALQVNFSPSAILSDTATPGFLSASAAESPTAVPSLYTAKHGQWTYPFSVTIYRGSTEYNPSSSRATRPAPYNYEPFGSIRFTVEQFINPNTLITQLRVRADGAQGTLSATPADPTSTAPPPYYWLQDPDDGKIYIFTANVAFSLDPSRGRVDTSLPPLATQNGVPLYRPAASPASLQPLDEATAGNNFGGNYGNLVETVFRQNTRDDDPTPNPDADYRDVNGNYVGRVAGGQTSPTVYIPLNQGIGAIGLGTPIYYEATYPLSPTPGTAYPSPFAPLLQATPPPYAGLLIVPGTERVQGPDNNLSLENNGASVLLMTYYRVPATASVSKYANILGTPATPQRFYQWSGQMNYQLLTDLDYYRNPILKFDENAGRDGDDAAGLPARALGDSRPQGELRVTYLWQNNFARDPAGRPINPQGEPTITEDISLPGQAQGQTIRNPKRPEADVFKLDYNTRALINITVGARVYDISTGQPQTAQVGDKVTVGNIGR